jgi:hypothetical protein
MLLQPDMCTWNRCRSGSRTFAWVLTCNMLHVMIETPHPLHTHIRSTLCIYRVFHHLNCSQWSYVCNPNLIYAVFHSQCGSPVAVRDSLGLWSWFVVCHLSLLQCVLGYDWGTLTSYSYQFIIIHIYYVFQILLLRSGVIRIKDVTST